MWEAQTAAVYGEVFTSAQTQMKLNQSAIEQRNGIGFKSVDELEQWAHEQHLDLLVLGKAQHQFFCVTHHGEIVNKRHWVLYYGNVLFTLSDENKPIPWVPTGLFYHDQAKINGERTDGLRAPLYHRDYFTPTGYFDPERSTFNIAKPFPVFAKETGRDTSHIYTLIEHIAGECTLYLLAWLRAKMINPTIKTEVVPVIISRAQGSGKSTFGEVICKGLFGADNVLVTDQYDSQARFNADYADALIVCQEEKEETDRRNPTASLKSRATTTTIRKEHKGLDPIYQDSYTEFVVTTNRDVPIKFEDNEQRRFMVMGADETFTRKTSDLANEVFSKLYGRASPSAPLTGIPFVDDKPLIEQFKHELFTREDIANTVLHKFPHTAAYDRCYSLPRTNEAVEIDSILRSLAPFIKASLLAKKIVNAVMLPDGSMLQLSSVCATTNALIYQDIMPGQPPYVAICRPIIFYDSNNGKPFQHSIVERTIYDCTAWLLADYGIAIIPIMAPVPGGFPGMRSTRHSMGPAARFTLAEAAKPFEKQIVTVTKNNTAVLTTRLGKRLRVNDLWQPDPDGAFETVNELKSGVETLENKTASIQYMDTFLLESDTVTKTIYEIESERLLRWFKFHSSPIFAQSLFAERLRLQRSEATRLFGEGKVCRVVYSGSKSYHMLVRVSDAPETLDEYKWLHAHLCLDLSNKLIFDSSTHDPARLTRAPITRNRISEYQGMKVSGIQTLIHENFLNVYDCNWRLLYKQWLERPLNSWEVKGRRLRPIKPEYQDAMKALLYGTFWTDSRWNGQRQTTFFPAYRICRLLGYSHDELWTADGILDGLDKYYQANERKYWRSRETCDLIRKIDNDVDNEAADGST
jgi:hypothetical protein